ncbi:MAG: choice-of-anchor D domain-containing protein [Alphaproteobacteria bacterium]|nr:choice-of-anchor D domain-containing protein [Alphaproteobacteria bacterium]
MPLLLLALLVACKGDDDTGVDSGPEAQDISISPREIDFGGLDAGEGWTLSEVVTITNEGERDLHILDLTLAAPEEPFELGSIGTVRIPGGQATTFVVTFKPVEAGAFFTAIRIWSDDPDELMREVLLQGAAVEPED